MSTRCLIASSLVACAVIGLASPPVRAAGEPTAVAKRPVWTGLVPDDAFIAAVLCPKRLLTSEGMAKFDIKGMADGAVEFFGGPAADMEQMVVVMGPPKEHFPQKEVIVRFSTHHGGADWATKYFSPAPAEEAEIAGHKYFHAGKTSAGGAMADPPAICFLDDRTLLLTDQSWLPKVFASKDAKSGLISALAAVDLAADATLLFTMTDASSEAISEMMPARAFPRPLEPLGDLPGFLQAANLTIRTRPEISLKLSMTAKDDASADKIDQTIKSLQQLGEAFLPALQIPPGEKMPAEQRESRTYAANLAAKLFDGLVSHRSGKQLTIEIDKLGTPEALFGKVLLPAIISARGAANRVQDENCVHQLVLAMVNYESTYGRFPAHAIYSKNGKPVLSWRVSLLPFLDQQTIYKQFHLDEPWDSPNNKPLIAKMPAVFKSASGKPLAQGKTRYVVPFGKNTIFDGDKGVRAEDITDGTSNTILLLEVGEDKAVTWTKPDDMDFDPQKPLAGLGRISEDAILTAFADGHVQTIRKGVDAETFRRLILRNDGLPVNPSELQAGRR